MRSGRLYNIFPIALSGVPNAGPGTQTKHGIKRSTGNRGRPLTCASSALRSAHYTCPGGQSQGSPGAFREREVIHKPLPPHSQPWYSTATAPTVDHSDPPDHSLHDPYIAIFDPKVCQKSDHGHVLSLLNASLCFLRSIRGGNLNCGARSLDQGAWGAMTRPHKRISARS